MKQDSTRKVVFVAGMIALAGGCVTNRLGFITRTPKPADFPDASAVWLSDDKTIEYQIDGDTGKPRVVVNHRLAIKLLTRKALTQEHYTPHYIHYDRTDSSVEDIDGRTIHPDGKVIEIDPSKDIADMAAFGRSSLYASSRVKRVRFAEACPGSVIELSYRQILRNPYHPVLWGFAREAPVLLSRLTLRRARGLRYRAVYRRDGRPAPQPTARRRQAGDLEIITWERRRLPALPDEPWSPPRRLRGDWLQIVPERYVEGNRSLTFFRSWDDFARFSHKLAAGRAKVTPEISKLARQLTAGADSDEVRARRLYHHVQKKIRYVAIEYGAGRWQPTAATETLQRGYGDCKDKATLLAALLAAVGVDSRLTLIGTRDKLPRVLDTPGLGAFNHMILAVLYRDGKRVLVDPTSRTTPFGRLPATEMDTQALVVHADRGEVIDTPRSGAARNDSLQIAELSVDAGGRFKGTLAISGRGHRLSALRHRLLVSAAGKHLEQFRRAVAVDGRTLKLSNLRVERLQNNEAPLTARADITVDLADRSGELLVLRLVRLFGRVLPRFVAPRRQTAVELGYRETRRYRAKLTWPAGTSVNHLPERVWLQSPFGSFSIDYKLSQGQLIVEASMRQEAIDVPPAQYTALRTFCDKVRRALNQGVTLKLGAE